MADFGTDLSTYRQGAAAPDLSFTKISGKRVVAEAVARRWVTPRGSLVTDEAAGVDLRAWIGASVTQADLYALASILETEAEKDERVADCDLVVSLDTSTQTLTVSGLIELSDESSFSIVLEVSSLSASLLEPT